MYRAGARHAFETHPGKGICFMKALISYVCSVIFLSGSAVFAQCLIATDDHANGPSGATLVTLGNTYSGEVETRRDRDYFCFDAIPYAEYTIVVTPGGAGPAVNKAEFGLMELDGRTRVVKKSSVNQLNAQTVYYNRSIARRMYIDVRSFAEYSEGHYELVVSMSGLPLDDDSDGLPNQWEIDNNLNPNSDVGDAGANGNPDLDSFTNEQEFLMGSDPRDPSSQLQLVASSPGSMSSTVSWHATPFAYYRILRSESITTPVWVPMATLPNISNTSTATFMDTGVPGGLTHYFYRVEFVP
jgi:hypothetical protein